MPPALLYPTSNRWRSDSFLAAIILVRRAVAPAARTLNDKDVSRGHLGLVERPQLFATSVRTLHVIFSRLAGFAARHAMRPHAPVAREDGRGHRLEKAHAPHGAVAAVPLPTAARALAHREALEAHREAPLEHFRIGQAGICHMGLHDVRAIEARARTRAAADRFVVLIALVAEREVVHRALGGSHHCKRAIEHLREALGSL